MNLLEGLFAVNASSKADEQLPSLFLASGPAAKASIRSQPWDRPKFDNRLFHPRLSPRFSPRFSPPENDQQVAISQAVPDGLQNQILKIRISLDLTDALNICRFADHGLCPSICS